MLPIIDRTIDRVEPRYRPSGVYADIEDRRMSILAGFGTLAVSMLVTVPFIALHWVAGERTMLVANTALLIMEFVSLAVFVHTGSTRVAVAIAALSLTALAITGHLALGGFMWSGGYLLYTPVVCLAALFGMRRSDAIALTVFCAGLVVAVMPFEAALQASRSQPALTYSVFLFAGCFFTLIGILTPVLIAVLGLLRTEQARSRALLLNILPESTANRLKEQPGMIADRYDGCTIVFADLVGFTAYSKGKEPEQIIGELNTIFTRFDAVAAQHGAEKIKTIGDGYMAATGLPDRDPDHVAHACDLALAMVEAMPALNAELGTDFQLRVGVNTGSAVAGVVGTSKFSYDVWGETVNLASRLESNGTPGLVVTSSAVVAALHGHHDVEPLGIKDLKGQGPTEIYRLARTHNAAVSI